MLMNENGGVMGACGGRHWDRSLDRSLDRSVGQVSGTGHQYITSPHRDKQVPMVPPTTTIPKEKQKTKTALVTHRGNLDSTVWREACKLHTKKFQTQSGD